MGTINNGRVAAWTRVTCRAVGPSVRATPSGTILNNTRRLCEQYHFNYKVCLTHYQIKHSIQLICDTVKVVTVWLIIMWWTAIDSCGISHLNIYTAYYVVNNNIAWIQVDQRLPRSDRG